MSSFFVWLFIVISVMRGESYMHRRTEWTLVRTMAYRLIDTERINWSNADYVVINCSLANTFQPNLNQNTKTSVHKNASEDLYCKYRPFDVGLDMYNDYIQHWPRDWISYRCNMLCINWLG